MASATSTSRNRSVISHIRFFHVTIILMGYLSVSITSTATYRDNRRSVHFKIDENQPVGSSVGRINPATGNGERRRNNQFYFAIEDDAPLTENVTPGDQLFAVNSTTGVLTTRLVLDRELIACHLQTTKSGSDVVDESDAASCVVKFTVSIRRHSPDAVPSHVVVVVAINDVNDNVPTFAASAGDDGSRRIPAAITRHVSEAAVVGDVAFTLPVAHDADADRKKNGRVAGYRLLPETGPFGLRPNASSADGDSEDELTVMVVGSIDRELVDQFNLTLIAYDAGQPSLSGTLSINVIVNDVNDNSPQFPPEGYDVTLADDAPAGTLVVKVTAFDPDLGDSGLVRYSFATRTQARYGTMFSIDPVSGDVTTSGHVTFGVTSSTIQLVLMAEDQGPNSVPSFASLVIRAMEANRHAPEIVFAPSDDVLSNSRSSDSFSANIAENSPPGSFIGHVVAQDQDVGRAGEVDCTITTGSDNFELVPLYGSEYRLVTRRIFDRETIERYEISLRCRDFGRPSMTSSTYVTVNVIDVDDHPPTFTTDEYNFTVAENNERGHVLGRVSAVDGDAISGSGIVYSLAEPDGDLSAWFSVDPTSGAIMARVPFDRELVDHFEFDVLANSTSAKGEFPGGFGGKRIAKAHVRVTVLDVDDEPPRFSRNWYRFDVAENQSGGTEVGRVEATDDDLPPFNGFFYQLDVSSLPVPTIQTGSEGDQAHKATGDTDVTGSSQFAIDPLTGIIVTRRSLDRETLSHYQLHIRARSDATSISSSSAAALSEVAVVFIRVTDVNDNTPEVTFPTPGDDSIVAGRMSDIRAGDFVAMVTARDRDAGPNARLSYSISTGNDEGRFEIGLGTGIIRWTRRFVSDEVASGSVADGVSVDKNGTAAFIKQSVNCHWKLKIVVQDSGEPIKLSSYAWLNVYVEDGSCRQVTPLLSGSASRRRADSDIVEGQRHHRPGYSSSADHMSHIQQIYKGSSGSDDSKRGDSSALLTDWHVFLVVVVLVGSALVVGTILTAAVILHRGCRSKRRQQQQQRQHLRGGRSCGSMAESSVGRADGDGARDTDDDDGVEMKFLKKSGSKSQLSTASSSGAFRSSCGASSSMEIDKSCGAAASGFSVDDDAASGYETQSLCPAAAVVSRGPTGEPVIVLLDPDKLLTDRDIASALLTLKQRQQQQQQQQRRLRPHRRRQQQLGAGLLTTRRASTLESDSSPSCRSSYKEHSSGSMYLPRDRDTDSGCAVDLSPAF